MYLEHFKISKFPFSLTPNTDFYCELPSHQEALNVLLVSLRSGEGFIKITGEVGTGKTLLCRLLLNKLDQEYITAYIHNPDLSPKDLRLALAMELGLSEDSNTDAHILMDNINKRLLHFHQQGKQVVLLIDEAQVMSEQCLETVRLLTNLETKTDKLLQVVLFGQGELDSKLNRDSLRQLKQRITFSYQLNPISKRELYSYLCHRLARAGHTYGTVFTPKACRALYRSSRGLPRLINVLCHKAMMVAYGRGECLVTHKAVNQAIEDTESAIQSKSNTKQWLTQSIVLTSGLAAIAWIVVKRLMI